MADFSSDFSMLRLDSSSSSLKRPSPPHPHQPNPKKEKLSPPLPPFPGFSKITPLPPFPKSGRNPLLRRCISNLDSHSPHVPSSTSEPTFSPAAKSASRTSSSSGDNDNDNDDSSPSTERKLKRIKDRFREMTLWFEQVMLEDADDDDDVIQVEDKAPVESQEEEGEGVEVINNAESTDENVQGLGITGVTKEDCDQKRFEELVSVEKVGECIVIHFSCHCGVPYQFLLAGGNCYYKLM